MRSIGKSRVWWVGLRPLIAALSATSPGGVLVVHRTAHLGVAVLCALVRLRRARVIFDFDDAIQLSWKLGFPHPLYYALPLVLRISDAAWCGSHYLAEYARKHTSALMVPTAVAPEFERAAREYSTPPTIVWVGNAPANLRSLRILVQPLERLSRVCSFRMQILSALGSDDVRLLFASLENRVEVDYGWSSWQDIRRIAEEVGRCDIGTMPLEDSPWSRGKCSLKALEAMASGLPVVVSDVGENSFVVGDQEYGLVARTSDDWYRALRALVTLPALRLHYGSRGRSRVVEKYSCSAVLKIILQSLHN